jgi:GT2 family glycosyltransferase/glycosyltransferase involved in cell wall biosynthesis
MRVLLVVHGYPPDSIGGTEVYTHDLAAALAADPALDVFVLTRDADPELPDGTVRRGAEGRITVLRVNNTFRSCTSFEETYRHPAMLEAMAPLVSEIAPDVVHVQHLTCLSTELVRHLSDRAIPIVLTLHDYWMLCHRGQLVDLDGRRCDGPVTGECRRCVPANVALGTRAYRAAHLLRAVPGAPALLDVASRIVNGLAPDDGAGAAAARLNHMRDIAACCDLLLAPSRTVAERFLACGMPGEHLEPCRLGIAFSPIARAPREARTPLRLGFVGSFLQTKAPHLLIEAASHLPDGSVTVDLAGAPADYHGDNSYQERLAPWLSHPVVRRYGPVPHHRMSEHLSQLDVLVLPSVWLENSPLVIKEAFAAGLPVVAADLGGMAELVRHEVDGLLFAPGDVASLAACLERLVAEPGLLDRLRNGIPVPLSIEEDAASLRGRYARLIAVKRAARPSPDAEPAEAVSAPRQPGEQVGAVILNYGTPDQTWLTVRSLQASFTPPASIVVVDNGSRDDSPAALRRMLDGAPAAAPVTLIETGRNLGFPAGCNVGIEAALDRSADLVLLVNSDVVLAPDALTILLAAARARPSAGILAPLILSREEPGRIESAGISYSVGSGRMRNLLSGRPASAAPVSPFAVPAVTGCVMLIRRAVLDRAGLFDGGYFFSFEDVDLCLRARSAGFETWCVPAARAHHEGGRTIGRRSARRVYFATRNHLKLAAGLESRRVRRTLTAGSIVALNTAYVITSPDAPLVSGLAAVVRGTWHHLLGREGPDPGA